MRSLSRSALLLLLAAVTIPAVAAEITLFEQDGFRGRSFAASQSISNFANVGYNDRASSVIVRSGTWQLCSDAYFRGRCVTVAPGHYANLSAMGLNDAVSSARELDWLGGGGPGGGTGGGASGPTRVELFEAPDFGARSFAVAGTIRDFAPVGFNDRAASMIVHEGTWEACVDADFRGSCLTYGPGRYPNLAPMNAQISSMRPISGSGEGGGWGGGGGWGSGSRAILYEQANLSGRSFTLNAEIATNFANTGFNDRASSLRIEGGYWIFCTDANFQGECQTFGPGDYPSLPWGMNNRISSGRRIHGSYPYSQNPMWQRP